MYSFRKIYRKGLLLSILPKMPNKVCLENYLVLLLFAYFTRYFKITLVRQLHILRLLLYYFRKKLSLFASFFFSTRSN